METGHSALYALLDLRNRQPDQAGRDRVDEQIRERFGARRAILIGDMSGFSKRTKAHGILHFLSVIRRMHELLQPVLERHGQLTKWEADNLYASFDHPSIALTATVELHQVCRAHNLQRAPEEHIVMSFGIGWGDVLDLDGHDYYGDEVNLASKLGEDIASRGQTLLTAAAVADAEVPGGHFLEQHSVRISGLELPYFSLEVIR